MRQPRTLKYLNSSRIIAFRNRLIHGYAGGLSDVVWGILETHVPTLRAEVAKLLEGQAQ